MDHVFNAMGDLFGAKFSSQWGAYDAEGKWLAELTHLSVRHLELGITRCREQVREAARSGDEAWPPQPVAFAALCEPRPEDAGLPAVADAWAEACAHAHEPRGHRWSHEAVRLAGNATGWWELRHVQPSRVDRLERRFGREYQALVNRVMAGEGLAERQLLEHDGSRSPAELAERAGREAAQAQAEAAGLPPTMKADEGLAALRAAVGRE
ncbi:replication protein P [Halomonas koreensis]|uniref:Replication protein P n=1 Tax=Halomonas koreensis TaxID=245385 RepID=A0ABU1G2Z2_9GAMM|nr:replication protein P [Halomonas koreensis]MDR5867276.1 replication protein P [Halomonas koreensis]